jgi:hypothetical protein
MYSHVNWPHQYDPRRSAIYALNDVDVKAPNPALSSGISQERENLMGFYAAGLAGYRGDRGAWARDIVPVLRRDPDNPYYRWFVGPTGAAN